jgi:hypothetical protein
MRETVCRAFADAYVAEGARVPSETQEVRYFERLMQAYPIHPEVFDRLYEDWTTIDGFQRTRGVLKLMAKVIYRLWKDGNNDLMILPGSLPLYDGSSRNELTYYLPTGWDPVIEKDIDGDRAESTELESKEPRFGSVQAARRICRTIFLGTAPSSVATTSGTRGLDRARILLGCLQPGQTASTFTDALNRMVDRAHYLNTSGDKALDSTRFWFDTRATLRREMEDRKRRFDEKSEVRGKMAEVLKKVASGLAYFDGIHIFTPHSDVPDDSSLRLVVLPPEQAYAKEEKRMAFDSLLDYVRNNGSKPRHRGNRLVFLAADHAALSRFRDCVRTALAWKSIVEDIDASRLIVDTPRIKQAKKELETSTDVLPRVARECYKWLLCPVQETPTEQKIEIEAFPLNTSGSTLSKEIERVCSENELVIPTWSPIHLRTKLVELYWKPDKCAVRAADFWEDTLRYLYLPRLKDMEVLTQAIVKGAATNDFFGTAYGQSGDSFEGFKLGDANIQVDQTLLLIEPATALSHAESLKTTTVAPSETGQTTGGEITGGDSPVGGGEDSQTATPVDETDTGEGSTPSFTNFHGMVEINPSLAKVKLVEVVDELISLLASDPNASVKVSLEISADFPEGVGDQIRRAVSENATALGLKHREWT